MNKNEVNTAPSNPKQKRWENTDQWARYTMINEELLSSDSPRGIWKISEKGMEFLSS